MSRYSGGLQTSGLGRFHAFPASVIGREVYMDDLMKIPGVGKNIAKHLREIGICCAADLIGKDPEELYLKDCLRKGFQEDRCQLYVFRCAVYYAEHRKHDPEKLKWWYWKDKEYPEREEKEGHV